MKINSLLESQTPSSAISNTTSSAPEFGRDEDKLEETTTSGAIASDASPVGKVRSRGSIFGGIKTSEKFPNSQAVKEADEWEEDTDKRERFLQYAKQKLLAAASKGNAAYLTQIALTLSEQDNKYFGSPFINNPNINNSIGIGSVTVGPREAKYTQAIASIVDWIKSSQGQAQVAAQQAAIWLQPHGKEFLERVHSDLLGMKDHTREARQKHAIALSGYQIEHLGGKARGSFKGDSLSDPRDMMTQEVYDIFEMTELEIARIHNQRLYDEDLAERKKIWDAIPMQIKQSLAAEHNMNPAQFEAMLFGETQADQVAGYYNNQQQPEQKELAEGNQFPEPRKPLPGQIPSKSEVLGKDGLIYHWQDPRAKQVVQGTNLKTTGKANLGNNPMNLPAGYGDVVQPQGLKDVEEAKKANSKTARKEFGKRVKAKPSDKEQEQKKSESDRLWDMLQAHIAQAEKEKVNEVDPQNYDSDEDYYDAVEADDLDLDKFTGDWDIPDEIAVLTNRLRYAKSQYERDYLKNRIKRYEDIYYGEDDLEEARVGNRMSDISVGSPKIVNYKGKAVGEVGIDHEPSPGNGPYYWKHYLTGKYMVGYDTKQQALGDLKYLVIQNEGGELEEGWKDTATLLGIPAVAGALAVGAGHLDKQQPHVEVGGQSAKIVRADTTKMPRDAMLLKGKDGKMYHVWMTRGTGSGHTLLASPAEEVKEGMAEGSAEDEYRKQSDQAWKNVAAKDTSMLGRLATKLAAKMDGSRKTSKTMGLHASLEQHADDKMKELGHKFKPVKESVDYYGDAERLKKQGDMRGYHKTMVRFYDAKANNATHRGDVKRYEALANKHHVASKNTQQGMMEENSESDRIQALYDKLERFEERLGSDDPRVQALKDEIRGLRDEYSVVGQNTSNSLRGELNEKSKSQAQFRTMAAVAHNPKFAKKVGISQKVGKEFHKADKGVDYKSLPKEVDEEKQRLDPKCWTGYKKQGTKMKGGVRVNNCVKVSEAEVSEDKLANELYKDLQIFKKGADKDIGSKAKDKELGNKPEDKDIVAKESFNGEYDDEAGSAESNLLTTARAVKGLLDTIEDRDNLPEWVQEKIAKAEGMLVATWDYLQSQKEQGIDPQVDEDWQKTNRKDKTDGMSPKAVKAYRRENPGSKLQTAVTKKPSELKAGSKDAKRRKSFCARMSGNKGPMKDEKGRPTPKAKALRRWNCE